MLSGLFTNTRNTMMDDFHDQDSVEKFCKEMELKLHNLTTNIFYSAKTNHKFTSVLHDKIQAGTDPKKLFKLITTVRGDENGKTILQEMLGRNDSVEFFDVMISCFGKTVTHQDWLLALTSNKDVEGNTPLHSVARNNELMRSFLGVFGNTPSSELFAMFTTHKNERGVTPLGYAIEVRLIDKQRKAVKNIVDHFTDIPGDKLFTTFRELKGNTLFNLFTTARRANSDAYLSMIKALISAPGVTPTQVCDQLITTPFVAEDYRIIDDICNDTALISDVLLLVIETVMKTKSAEEVWLSLTARRDDSGVTNLFKVAKSSFQVFLNVMACFEGKLTTAEMIEAFSLPQEISRMKCSSIFYQAVYCYRMEVLIPIMVKAGLTPVQLLDMLSRSTQTSNLLSTICDTKETPTTLTSVLDACDKIGVSHKDVFALASRAYDPCIDPLTPIQRAANNGNTLIFLRYFKSEISLAERVDYLLAMPDNSTSIILRGPDELGPQKIFEELADELAASPELSEKFFTTPVNRSGMTMQDYAQQNNWPNHACMDGLATKVCMRR